MEIDRETLIEVAVSVVAVGFFIGVLVLIGLQYNDSGLSDQGGFALVAAIVAFIVGMVGVGYWLSSRGA